MTTVQVDATNYTCSICIVNLHVEKKSFIQHLYFSFIHLGSFCLLILLTDDVTK